MTGRDPNRSLAGPKSRTAAAPNSMLPNPLCSRMHSNRLTRREFITLLGGAAAAWPLGARAQHTAKAPTLGLLYPGPQAPVPSRVEALLDGLRAAGFLAPAQVEIVLRVADNDPSR